MKRLGLAITAFALLAAGQLPSSVLGKWAVGQPYDDLGQPIGLNAKQERAIIGLVIRVSSSQLAVCGKDVPITSVKVDHLTSSDFLAKYNFTPDRIGFSDGPLIEISLNKLHSTGACGDFADPGTEILMGKGHAVVIVANDYFRFTKR